MKLFQPSLLECKKDCTLGDFKYKKGERVTIFIEDYWKEYGIVGFRTYGKIQACNLSEIQENFDELIITESNEE